MSGPTPLTEMSSNVQESDAAGRKRSHDDFADDTDLAEGDQPAKRPVNAVTHPSIEILLHSRPDRAHQYTSPQGSPALTEGGNSPASQNSPSPTTPSKRSTEDAIDQVTGSTAASKTTPMANQAQKRKRLTAAEKEARDKEAAEKKLAREREAAEKKREREEKAAARAIEQARAEEEKAARAKEREEKRKKKEEEERAKAQEREEKKRKKEEEQRLIQEAKEKKARQQPKLNSFFGGPAAPRKPIASSPQKGSPRKDDPSESASKSVESEYQKVFKPFFVKENTTLATPATRLDEETRQAKSAILDEFISGKRTHDGKPGSFDPMEVLSLPCRPQQRGRLHHPVKHIMEEVYREAESTGADGASKVMEKARRKLSNIPIKVISFSQDVRPPYYGTMTLSPFVLGKDHMRRLAVRSTGRRMPLDYDYDSEAEWQDEEGEDLDADDDEEEVDDEDDMDGFLDDSEDVGPARRIFINTMEPESSGICFEDENRKVPNDAVRQHRMEVILDTPDQAGGLDPWTTAYWEPEPKAEALSSASKMPPPRATVDGSLTLGSSGPPPTTAKLVKKEIMDDVKKAILDNRGLSKAGIVDYVFQQFRNSASRVEVKNTIEHVAEKKGQGKIKEWALKDGHKIAV